MVQGNQGEEMSKINTLIETVKNQIEDGTIVRSCVEGAPKTTGNTSFPAAGIIISGGDMRADANGTLDEDLYMTIVVVARSIEDFYDVVDALKVLWYDLGGVTSEFHDLRSATSVIKIDPMGPVGYPLTLPLNDKSNYLRGQITFKVMLRHTY